MPFTIQFGDVAIFVPQENEADDLRVRNIKLI